ncbi:hypothetical protein HQ590_09590 [bacterium]|nr:hypothetical protein [bacterium]
MAREIQRQKMDIDVTGYLSIMAIVLKLITLILAVVVIRIAMNPDALKIISLGLFTSTQIDVDYLKIPSYIDCFPDHLVLYPGDHRVTWEDLQQPGNRLEQFLDKVQAGTTNEYVIVMARPGSVKLYRTVRNLVGRRPIDVGYDAVDTNFRVDWSEAEKALKIVE